MQSSPMTEVPVPGAAPREPMPAPAPLRPQDGQLRRTLPVASWVELVRRRAAEQPDVVCLLHSPQLLEITRQLTWADLDLRARAVAAALQQGTRLGERCLLLLENDLDYVIAFFACAYAGRVGVTLHVPMQKKHIDRLGLVAADCKASLVLSTRGLRARFGPAVDGVVPGASWIEVDAVPDATAVDWQSFAPCADDPCYLQYTSGSTATPRGVAVSHAALLVQGELLNASMGFHRGDLALSWLPLYHDMGLILGVLQPLYTGFPVILTPPTAFIKEPIRWLRAISQHRITYTGGPNFAYDLCMDVIGPAELEGLNLSCWDIATNGAEPIRTRTLDRFAAWAGPVGFRPEAFHTAYGLAEATLALTTSGRGMRPVRRIVDPVALSRGEVRAPEPSGDTQALVSSGRVSVDTVLRIVEPFGKRVLGPLEVGEIWAAGSTLADGYYGRPAETEHTFRARLPNDPWGYLRTGDLGFFDENGELFITGRAKDVIIVRGRNHYPQDLEQTAEELHPCLRVHWVVAFSIDTGAEEEVGIVAEVRASAMASADLDAVAAQVLRGVSAKHEVRVAEVLLIAEKQMPKTTSGKLQRSLCRRLRAEGAFVVLGRAIAGGGA